MRSFSILAIVVLASGCVRGPGGGSLPALLAPHGLIIGAHRPGTHSHNDFERRRPLAEALEQGFASIEVDVALRDGEFYVTHDSADIDTDATLRGMYLRPLQEVARRNGGTIYSPSAPPLQLLIDVKSEAVTAFEALDSLLVSYGDLATRWTEGTLQSGAITVVVSGNRAREEIRARTTRSVALDGRIWEGRENFSPSIMPLVSINWDDTKGSGNDSDPMTVARRLIDEVHSERRLVRFWGTPDRPEVWAWLRALGADYVGTDNAADLADFLDGR